MLFQHYHTESFSHTWGYDADAALHLKDFKAKIKMLTKADTQYLEVSLPFRLRMSCEQPEISCRWGEDKIQIIQDVAS